MMKLDIFLFNDFIHNIVMMMFIYLKDFHV